MRKNIIAGNWKMNKTSSEAEVLITELIPKVKDATCDVVICVPYTDLKVAVEKTKGTNIKVGSQNVHWADNGAFTGEIAASMLNELGVEYVIIGHSERRQYFGETDETVNKRVKQALLNNLKPIVCIGELLEERENGTTNEVVKRQIEVDLDGLSSEDFNNVVIAYEPVWAIGTGKTATAKDANETIGYIRSVIGEKFGPDASNIVRIQYGGSMNAKNCNELMNEKEIDGGLIGGASLKSEDFAVIVESAKQ